MKKIIFIFIIFIAIILIAFSFNHNKVDVISTSQELNIISEPEIIESEVVEKFHTNKIKKDSQINIKPINEEPVTTMELPNDLDFSSFKPSYNLLVSMALEYNHKSLTPYNENTNWSLMFLNTIIKKSNNFNKANFSNINIINNLTDFQAYITSQETYYIGNKSCLPIVGDIILYDNDLDGNVDNISIISEYSDYKITDVAGNRWCDKHQRYEVLTETKSISNPNILGIYRPNYDIIRLKESEHLGLSMNAVDTVVSINKEEHVKILAENGIEVFARYINPEGRIPLTLEDAKLFSKYGIRTMLIYQINKADPYKGYETGIEFGTKALEYAKALNAPKGTPIFFCCDCASDFSRFGNVAEFIRGVKDAFNGEYSVGLYGGFYINEAMYNINMIDAYWQCWGLSDKYVSNNYDIIQWSSSTYFFENIPYVFDANYVKNPEKVSYILEDENGRTEKLPVLQRDGEKILTENR